jgi:site-specific DNA-cytosine methylase
MNTIELFCGTKSFSKVAKDLDHKTFTVDNNEYFKPDICKDILQLKRKDLPKQIDIVWASPPCTCFSVASIGSTWCGNYCPKRVETALGIAYVLKTLKLIEEIKPKYWFIENPRGVLRKMAFMKDLPRYTITYCQYGDNRMKPTDIWTNFDWKPKPMCKNGDKCHESAPRGSKTGTQGLKEKMERGIIPRELFIEIFKQLKESGCLNYV